MASFDLVATTAFGIEAIVKRELKALGIESTNPRPGRIVFSGDWNTIAQTNIQLRCADRILIRLANFQAKDFGELFDGVHEIPWEKWLTDDAIIHVNGRSHKSQLSSVPACQKIVKKAIVERLLKESDIDELPETGERYVIEVALLSDEAWITLDTTGPSLHKRGYRKLVWEAPLKETLAAALIQLSFWTPERALHDPFCGSGTIPIEAAMLAKNIAPGLHREFSAENWACTPRAVFKEQRELAQSEIRDDVELQIFGTDIDPEALKMARYHAEQAGVADCIHWQRKDFSETLSKRMYGCLITNPPYGERLHEQDELRPLYESMPQTLKRLKSWSHYILTSFPQFEDIVGRKADRRRKLYNAQIECTYYQFFGPKPNEEIQKNKDIENPAFGAISANTKKQADLLCNRLKKNARHLRRWPKRGITCYRLYDRDIPEVPLCIDRYEDNIVMSEYDRPHDHSVGEHQDWLQYLAKCVSEVLEVPREQIFLKQRQQQKGLDQYEKIQQQKVIQSVSENDLKFEVNFSDYLDTGLFLDHRLTREMVKKDAKDKDFLNLFAYTGSFSVYAAAGGAKSTTTIDLSNTYMRWAGRNMDQNGFSGDEHAFIRSDVMTALDKLIDGKIFFDLIVSDVPTFSNSKKNDDDWDVQKDHVALINKCLEVLRPGGTIYFSTNYKKFKMEFTPPEDVKVFEISKKTVPEDFRNKRIHRCWRIIRSES